MGGARLACTRNCCWLITDSGLSLPGSGMAAIHSRISFSPSSWTSLLPSSGIMIPASRRGDPESEDGAVRLAGHDVVLTPARSAAGGDGGLVDSEGGGVLLRRQQVEPGVSGWSLRVVAVGAVDLEPGAGAGVEAAARRIVPDRQPGCLRRRWGTGQRPQSGPVIKLVFGSRRIGEVAVQVPGLRSDGRDRLARLVASLALVGVGDDVVVGTRLRRRCESNGRRLSLRRDPGRPRSGRRSRCRAGRPSRLARA